MGLPVPILAGPVAVHCVRPARRIHWIFSVVVVPTLVLYVDSSVVPRLCHVHVIQYLRSILSALVHVHTSDILIVYFQCIHERSSYTMFIKCVHELCSVSVLINIVH